MRRVLCSLFLTGLLAAPTLADDARPTVLFLVADGFNHGEFHTPWAALAYAGYDIVIAAPEAGEVSCGNHKEPEITADLALKDVKVDDYFGLMIPGGYAPAELAKHQASLDIVRGFVEADKPIAAICHGPMLLLDAGVLKDRPFTCLWSVKDERPEAWKGGSFGAYIDEPYVVDGNLITGRHVADLDTFAPAMLRHFAAAGGVSLTTSKVNVAVTVDAAEKLSKHERWLLTHAGSPAKVTVELGEGDAEGASAAVTVPIDADDLRAIGGAARAWDAAHQHGDSSDAKPNVGAVIVLTNGYDESVVAAMRAWFAYREVTTAVAAPQAGWVRGLSGGRIQAEAIGHVASKDGAILLAPSVVWPEEDEDATDPRMAYLVEAHGEGHRLIAFGRDTYALAQAGDWKDKSFASSGQALWYFKRTGNKFTDEPAVLTAERLITASGPEALAEVMKLIDEHWLTDDAAR